MNKIVIFTSNRADYNKLKPILNILHNSKKIKYYLIVYGSHLLDKFGNTIKFIKYKIHSVIDTHNEKLNMNETFIKGMDDISSELSIIKPDAVIIHGDRYDTLSIAMSCILMNIYIIHIEGGELSGTVDGKIRHAISKLANCHLVSNDEARNRLIKMGEQPSSVHVTGCPAYDEILSIKKNITVLDEFNVKQKDYIISVFHPVTTDINETIKCFTVLLKSLINTNKKVLLFYPNVDDGSKEIYKIIENNMKEIRESNNFTFISCIDFYKYINLIHYSGLIIGNSSSIVREACIFGIPSILIGSRQNGRKISKYTKKINNMNELNYKNIIKEIDNMYGNRYPIDNIYGDGKSAEKIKNILGNLDFTKIDKVFYE